ncbi:T9SS type A sorting domain-containing protein [Flavobacterium flavigenum]|uniref:T9SS type A sorting domain-containing protein n=1 Tax=Flavobacterium flavigenum TaxID=3003258 RepID=UPI0022AC4421|nr:T9SS type A sorting domain-containing protein [Flavobacterium flavigenum]
MKRELLYFTSIVLFATFSVNAQKTWNFSDDKANWPTTYLGLTSTTPVTTIQIDLLNLTSHTTSNNLFGAMVTTGTTYSDGFIATDGIKTNGNATVSNNLPSTRYFSFNVDGACSVKVWFRHGSNSGADRNLTVSNGVNVLATASVTNTAATSIKPNEILTAPVSAAGKIYIYSDANVTIHKIEVVGAAVVTPSLGTNDFHADAVSNVFSNGKSVFVSNVKSDTQVDVYGISGALVKSFKTGADTSFDLNTGLYVVRSKSAEGIKTAKVLVN